MMITIELRPNSCWVIYEGRRSLTNVRTISIKSLVEAEVCQLRWQFSFQFWQSLFQVVQHVVFVVIVAEFMTKRSLIRFR